ncbi:MAG: hypothetical protein NTW29_07380 [Bacteroidetes bacterium]|nr:hypothetical protein [Bacteroidota bacterium]
MTIQYKGIILFVQQVQELALFYTRYFGYQITSPQDDNWMLLTNGNAELGLHRMGEDFLSPELTNSETNTKLLFEINDGIEDLHTILLQSNTEIGAIKSWDNYPYLLFDGKDPEGNVFQVRQPK